MINGLTVRLQNSGALVEQDVLTLQRAARIRRLPSDWHLAYQGEMPQFAHVLLQGYICRYKTKGNGRRQIAAILVPGDICDLHGVILKSMDHGVKTLTDCVVAEFPCETLLQLIDSNPGVARAFWWSVMADEAILREWLVNVGRQDARQRIAHLFCDLLVRLQAVGLADGDKFDFPLTQEELGDMAGLSTVHVNRTIQDLRSDGCVALRGKNLIIRDVARLKEIAHFEPDYLYF